MTAGTEWRVQMSPVARGSEAMTERFTLLSELGRGGMGVVWKARDEKTGQVVALKLLREVYAEDPDYVTRFERELELAKRIQSPNVVGVLGFGVRDGTPYLALEYVDGPSLRERLAAHGPYSWAEARPLLAQIAQGLDDAHAAGVIHRDLKPYNVLIGSDGVAKLADFGIAKGLDLTRATGTSTLLGTPAYLAPEGPADARSDLYSLGVVAYEILTGVVPFEGRTYQEVILRHVRETPDLAKLPKDARQIVGRLLAKSPTKRPQSASGVVTALLERPSVSAHASAAAPAAASITPASPGAEALPVVLGPRIHRRSALVGLGVVVCLLVTAGVALAGAFFSAAPSPTASPALAAAMGSTGPRASGSPRAAASPDSLASMIASQEPTPSTAPTYGTPAASTTLRPVSTQQSALQSTSPPVTGPTSPPVTSPTSPPTPNPAPAEAYVRGAVTATEGGPLAGILVSLCTTDYVCFTANSGVNGTYSVGPLAPGRYTANFADLSGQRTMVFYGSGSGTTCSASQQSIDVGASDVSGIDVAMPLGYQLSGTLTSAPGKSLPPFVIVYVERSDGSCPGWSGNPIGADGSFYLSDLAPGVYIIKIVSGEQSVYWSSSGLVADIGSATPVTMTGSSVGGIDGQLPW